MYESAYDNVPIVFHTPMPIFSLTTFMNQLKKAPILPVLL